jgi:5'-nucleotidase
MSLVRTLLLALWLLTVPAWAGEPFTLRVLHVNDTHSHLEPTDLVLALGGEKVLVRDGGYPALLTRIADVRGREGGPLLLLHAGDAVQGTLYYSEYKGRADMDLLNRMGFAAMVPGNHEFDLGPEQAGRLADMAAFPWVSANLNATDEPALAGKVRSWVLVEAKGRKVGIFGLTTPKTTRISQPGPRLRFEDPARSARRAVAELKAQGAEAVIALTHLGYGEDLKLARGVAGIDLVVGGHSHTRLAGFENLGLPGEGPYPTLVAGPDGRRACVVQAWEWGKVLGDVDLSLDGQGRVTDCAGRPVMVLSGDLGDPGTKAGGRPAPLTGERLERAEKTLEAAPNLARVREDEAALALLAPYRQGLEAFRRTVLAVAEEDLVREKELALAAGASRRPEDIRGVGALVAASMLWKTRPMGAVMALHNRGGTRIDLPRGNVTLAQAGELLPFGNTLVLVTLRGADIRKALEKGISAPGSPLCLAGVRVRSRDAASGKRRLASVEVERGGAWVALRNREEYRVALSSYLAGGGDGFAMLRDRVAAVADTGFVDAEVFADYARAMGRLRVP